MTKSKWFWPAVIVAAVIIVAVVLGVVLTRGSGGGSSTSTTTSTSGSTTTAADPAVMDLQKVMTRLGYYSGPIDGIYGDATTAAVTAMQKPSGSRPMGSTDRPRPQL